MSSAESSGIKLPEPVLSAAAHSSHPLLALGLINGAVGFTSITQSNANDEFNVLATYNDSCRAVGWMSESKLLAGLTDGKVCVYDVLTRKQISEVSLGRNADGFVSPSTFLALTDSTFVIGDDDGGIHLADDRQKTVAASVLEQADYISQMSQVEMFGKQSLLASSGDGTLCAYDAKISRGKVKLMYAFDPCNDDLLSFCVLHTAGLVVGGTLSGNLHMYDARFLDESCELDSVHEVDRMPGHPECVSSVVPFNQESLVCTASSDGILRIVDVVNRALVYSFRSSGEAVKESVDTSELWPIESMVEVHGLGNRLLALQGHESGMSICPMPDERIIAALLRQEDDESEQNSQNAHEDSAAPSKFDFFDGL